MTSPQMTSVEGGLRVSTAGEQMLNSVLNAAALNLYDLPGKQYVTTGPAVFDCEQVAVSLLRIDSGISMNPAAELIQAGAGCDFGWSILAEIAIVRCAPKPNTKGVVPATKLMAGTEQSSQDAFILMSAIESLAQSAWGGFSASLMPNEIEGGFVATSANVKMVLL